MKNNLNKFILLAVLASTVSCTNFMKKDQATVTVKQKPVYTSVSLSEESKLALLWQQKAAESKALAYQAFNIASQSIEDNAISKVYIDVDEAVLDNSPYFAWLIVEDQESDYDNYSRWINSMDAPAIDGAVDFLNSLAAKKVEVFYVMERESEFYDVTLDNIAKVGVKGDINFVSKADAAKELENESAMFISSNLNSFNPALSETLKKRNKEAFALSDSLGATNILIPNLMYGQYFDALAENYENLSEEEKSAAKLSSMTYWRGSKEAEIKEY